MAIKVLHPEYSKNLQAVRRFMREAQTTTRIAHPNIVEMLDMGQEQSDRAFYIVQEFLHGRGPAPAPGRARRELAPHESLDVMVPMAGALVAAHRTGWCTGTSSPRTSSSGEGQLREDRAGSDRLRAVQGGAHAAAVGRGVHARGHGARHAAVHVPGAGGRELPVDERTDVWVMGIVLYEMLCGCCPVEGTNPTVVIIKVLSEEPPRIETFWPEAPKVIADEIHRALVPDRDHRTPTIRAFLEGLLDASAVLEEGAALRLMNRHRGSLPEHTISTRTPSHPQDVHVELLEGEGGTASRARC